MVQASSYKYMVGNTSVTVLNDGDREAGVAGYVADVPEEAVKAVLQAAGLAPDKIATRFAPILIESGGKRVLIDTGNGEKAFQESNGRVGLLLQSLSEAGIDRRAIDVVILSHFHGDHVNGLLMADGSKAFPEAEICVPEAEWNFWMNDAEMAKAPEGRMKGLFANNRRIFDALDRKVRTFAWGSDVIPGLKAVATPGHSIGHTSFLVSSGNEQFFVQVDIANHAVVFTHHPEWHGWFDQDPVQASKTRISTYKMLAEKRIPVQAFHFPWPGRGYIEKNGEGFRFVPADA